MPPLSPMNPNDDRVEAIFHAALELSESTARGAYLGTECGDDLALEMRVRRLLEAHENPEGLLGDAPFSPEVEEQMARLKPEEEGERIGPYKLLQQIGEGGFGTVWMAEQDQPVRRRVALKILKMGMDTKEVIARFEQERQALAMMEHPNIAKVFDAGATQYGRPFFVMELVRGVKITDYCDQQELPTSERLALFIHVCQAVQHAHQKGIIHRDLKPSNILVTINDGEPVPKVIDFGVAKATQGRLTDGTFFTQFEQMVGTPLYMSPEQAELTSLDIDTRSDIYSLGVLLYELLTGRTPIDTATMARAGMDEIRRIIREVDPPRPSARVKTLDGNELTTAAKRRHTEAAKLPGALRGDLDWIVMKCLEKDRKRRYDTANGLAADLKRHLANEIVSARPPTAAYLVGKLVRRHRGLVGAALAVLIALCAGLIASLWLYRREVLAREHAIAEEHKAEVASAKSAEAARFLKEMLQSVGPSVARGRDTVLLREILDKAAERVGTKLRAQPEVEAEMRTTLGEVYLQLADYGHAEMMMHEALALTRQIFDDGHGEVATAMGNLGRTLLERGKWDEAETQMRGALAIQRRVLGAEHLDVASTLSALASVRFEQHQWDDAEKLAREALGMRKRLAAPESVVPAASLAQVAEIIGNRRKLDEAERLIREALQIFAKCSGADDMATLDTRSRLASILTSQGKFAEAADIYREVLATKRRLYGENHPSIAGTLQDLGVVLMEQKNDAEAEAILKQALDMQNKFRSNARGIVSVTLGNLAVALARQGKQDEVDRFYRELVPIEAASHLEYFGLFSFGAQFYTHNRRFTEAAAEMAKAVAVKPDDGLARLRLEVLRVSGGDLAGYERDRRELLERFRATRDPQLAEVVAKTCLLLPGNAPDIAIAGDLADFSVEQKPDNIWAVLAKELADYRRGRFKDAISREEEALKMNKISPPFIVAAQAISSLSHFRLGEKDRAAAALSSAREVAREKMGELSASNVFWEDWHNVLVAEILLHEAGEQISQ